MKRQAIVLCSIVVAAGFAIRHSEDEASDPHPQVRGERPRESSRAIVRPTPPPSVTEPSAEKPVERETLDEVMARSPAADGAWTREIELRLRDVLADPRIEGSRMSDMQCRGSLCKVTIEHRDEATRADLRLALVGFPAAQIQGKPIDDTTTALYITR